MNVPRVLVVAGEASGDAHAAAVLKGLIQRVGPVDARGMGGAALSRAGLALEVDLRRTTAMGLVELGSRLPMQLVAFARLVKLALRWLPRAALLVDVPDFNLPLGAALRRAGIPVLGYVAPQFWAWRPGRLRVIARSYDRLACIVPFEVKPLRDHGVDAVFVGHPAAEHPMLDVGVARRRLGVTQSGGDPTSRILALLPGSRPAEVARLLRPMFRAAERLRRVDPALQIFLARASSVTIESEIPEWIRVVSDAEVPAPGQVVLDAADAAVVASGTAALEAAMRGTPQVVIYRLSRPTYHVARLVVRSRFIALPNIIANAPVVPELLQDRVNEDCLVAHLTGLLAGDASAASQRQLAGPLLEGLRGPGATPTTASMLARMLRR